MKSSHLKGDISEVCVCVCVRAALKRTCDVQFVCHSFKALTFLQISCSGVWRGDIMVLVSKRRACHTALSLSPSDKVS